MCENTVYQYRRNSTYTAASVPADPICATRGTRKLTGRRIADAICDDSLLLRPKALCYHIIFSVSFQQHRPSREAPRRHALRASPPRQTRKAAVRLHEKTRKYADYSRITLCEGDIIFNMNHHLELVAKWDCLLIFLCIRRPMLNSGLIEA